MKSGVLYFDVYKNHALSTVRAFIAPYATAEVEDNIQDLAALCTPLLLNP